MGKSVLALEPKATEERVMLLRNDEPRWARVPDAARHFNIPRNRMYQLIHTGVVPAVRLGERSIRVDLREAERLLKEKRRVVAKDM